MAMKKSKKILLGVLIPVLAIILIALIGLIWLCLPSAFNEKRPDLSFSYGTVLADIDGIKEANPRFIDTAVLGSHDSFSSLIGVDNAVVPSTPPMIKAFLPVLRNYLVRFAVTQNVNIFEQLMQGARFLQIKVTPRDGEFYSSHTMYSGSLKEHITNILMYLTSDFAKGEVVGILFQPTALDEYTYADLHEAIKNITYNGRCLYDFVHYPEVNVFHDDGEGVRIGDLRYNDLTKNGEAPGVVLLDRRPENYQESWDSKEDNYRYFFDMDSNAFHPWHNSSSTKILSEKITETANLIRSSHEYDDLLRVNQTQGAFSTSSLTDIVCDFSAVSLLNLAQKHNVLLIEREDFFDLLAAMPVYQVDNLACSHENFNARVNALIRSYNETLVQKALA